MRFLMSFSYVIRFFLILTSFYVSNVYAGEVVLPLSQSNWQSLKTQIETFENSGQVSNQQLDRMPGSGDPARVLINQSQFNEFELVYEMNVAPGESISQTAMLMRLVSRSKVDGPNTGLEYETLAVETVYEWLVMPSGISPLTLSGILNVGLFGSLINTALPQSDAEIDEFQKLRDHLAGKRLSAIVFLGNNIDQDFGFEFESLSYCFGLASNSQRGIPSFHFECTIGDLEQNLSHPIRLTTEQMKRYEIGRTHWEHKQSNSQIGSTLDLDLHILDVYQSRDEFAARTGKGSWIQRGIWKVSSWVLSSAHALALPQGLLRLITGFVERALPRLGARAVARKAAEHYTKILRGELKLLSRGDILKDDLPRLSFDRFSVRHRGQDYQVTTMRSEGEAGEYIEFRVTSRN